MPHEDPAICAQIKDLHKAIEAIGNKMDVLSGTFALHVAEEERVGPQLDEIITAWQQGLGIAKFVKTMAALGTFVAAIALYLHDKVVWK